MAIQWFPGHMHLTRKAIEERIKDIDVNAVVRFCDLNANFVFMAGSNDVFPLPSAPGTAGLLERSSILPRRVVDDFLRLINAIRRRAKGEECVQLALMLG